MEKKSIITGKTLEEAKANVAAQLGLDADSYSYQVVQMPKSVFWASARSLPRLR